MTVQERNEELMGRQGGSGVVEGAEGDKQGQLRGRMGCFTGPLSKKGKFQQDQKQACCFGSHFPAFLWFYWGGKQLQLCLVTVVLQPFK